MMNIYSQHKDSLDLFPEFKCEHFFFLVCLVLHAGVDSEARLSLGAIDLDVDNHFPLSVFGKVTVPLCAPLQRSFLNFDVLFFAFFINH